MATNWSDRTLALAGMVQASHLVHQLATTGRVDTQDLHTAIQSLFEQNPSEITQVYGGVNHLLSGLTTLETILKREPLSEGNEIVRYTMGIVHLQKKLMKQHEMLNTIGQRLQKSKEQAELFDTCHENVIASLADIYTSTISTFSFRIQVTGDYNYLQQSRIGNQIRVLLFAGIRSAILWRQLGGSRLHIITQRKTLIKEAQALIKQAKEQLLH